MDSDVHLLWFSLLVIFLIEWFYILRFSRIHTTAEKKSLGCSFILAFQIVFKSSLNYPNLYDSAVRLLD